MSELSGLVEIPFHVDPQIVDTICVLEESKIPALPPQEGVVTTSEGKSELVLVIARVYERFNM